MTRKKADALSLEELVEMIGEVVDLSGLSPDAEAVLGEDVPVDSKDMLRILSRLESRYSFRFAPSEVMALRTVGALLEAVRGKG